jgi:hypothetical protein
MKKLVEITKRHLACAHSKLCHNDVELSKPASFQAQVVVEQFGAFDRLIIDKY